jgi:hypothetical protein
MTRPRSDVPAREEAIRHARAMVVRYELAVVTHPAEPDMLTARQQAEAANLTYWRRRLARITTPTPSTTVV